jgi:hypothetical protein
VRGDGDYLPARCDSGVGAACERLAPIGIAETSRGLRHTCVPDATESWLAAVAGAVYLAIIVARIDAFAWRAATARSTTWLSLQSPRFGADLSELGVMY